MPTQTPIRIIYIVVISEAVLALIGVSALCLTLFYKNYADPSVLTALIAITSGLVGALGTILTNTRQNTNVPPNGNPPPQPVQIQQPPQNPVPVVPVAQP
jgi:uncharacterized membrane protein YfbV (UPF0208 family)